MQGAGRVAHSFVLSALATVLSFAVVPTQACARAPQAHCL
jgi:hypothetical protein